jgi:hypothetical protein
LELSSAMASNAVTTARYAHLDADPLRIASERIGSTIAAAIGEERKSSRERSSDCGNSGRVPVRRSGCHKKPAELPRRVLSGLWLSRQTQASAGRPESAPQNCRSELWLRNEIRVVCDEFLTT